jgi:hypothetical protein
MSADSLLFYAWYDAQSGTLRLSATCATTPNELPFSCELRPVLDPTAVSSSLLGSAYLGGIPESELSPSSWAEESPTQVPAALTVFWRALPGSPRAGTGEP